MSNYK